MREIIVWTLVALTLFLVALFWVKPIVFPVSSVKQLVPISKTYKWDWKAPVPPPPSTKGGKSGLPPIKADKGFKLYDAPIIPAPPKVPSPGPAPLPPTKYEKFKQEVRDWSGILGKFSPLITTILLFVVKRRGKKVSDD